MTNYGNNLTANPITVRHAELRRYSGHFRRCCPKCPDGIMLVSRDPTTFELIPEDHCISCGQRVVYADIEDMRVSDVWRCQ